MLGGRCIRGSAVGSGSNSFFVTLAVKRPSVLLAV